MTSTQQREAFYQFACAVQHIEAKALIDAFLEKFRNIDDKVSE